MGVTIMDLGPGDEVVGIAVLNALPDEDENGEFVDGIIEGDTPPPAS